MKLFIGCFIGLVLSVSVGAESLLEGRVRLSSGQPAVGVHVRLFDLTDLRRFVGTTTDESGHFALPLRAFSMARGTALPTDFALGQNYPNPFNPSTVIPYQLPMAAHVRLEVFNLLGQRLATLVDGERSAGMHTVLWDATDAAGRAVGAGVYIYRLSSGGMTESRRMVLVDGQAGILAAVPGSVRATAPGVVEADGSVYGLTVSGEGLVAYVNPTFRVGVDEADIVVEEHGGMPRMKRTTSSVLGDVNNDGQVDVSDVLYVLLYVMTDSSMILPNNGDISLGDVNKDGTVDLADVLLLVRHIDDPSDPMLPAGVGDDYGDTLSEATEVFLGSSIFGSISEGDVDYFFIEMSSEGALLASVTSNIEGTYGSILDSSGNVLVREFDFDTGSDIHVSVPVSLGTYYIVVEGYDSATGDYMLDMQSLSYIVTNLTQSAGSDGSPAWSPDGQRIVFESERDGNSEVYVMDADGSNPTNLTQSAGSDRFPVWSPDGQRIAFVSERDGPTAVYVMDADGTNRINLTQDIGGWSPAWSPDGQRIAFVSFDSRYNVYDIYVMDADGTNLTNFTRGTTVRFPVWSPDGQHIAFVSELDWSEGFFNIYVMDADGTNRSDLTQDTGGWSPAWSPDGQRIAFVSFSHGDRDIYDIYVVDSDGSNLTLTQSTGSDWSPVWSPDSQRLAFVSNRDGNSEIYVIDFD